MLNFSHQTRVFLFVEPVDMRKSFRGLCMLAESVLKEDPASGHWFAFVNRRRDRLKLLGWDGQGFWIWYKRLESGVFEKPASRRGRVRRVIPECLPRVQRVHKLADADIPEHLHRDNICRGTTSAGS